VHGEGTLVMLLWAASCSNVIHCYDLGQDHSSHAILTTIPGEHSQRHSDNGNSQQDTVMNTQCLWLASTNKDTSECHHACGPRGEVGDTAAQGTLTPLRKQGSEAR
jgi:hypothetical protein